MPVQVASLFGVISLRDADFKRGMQGAKAEFSGLSGLMSGTVQNVQTSGKVILGAMGGVAIGAGLAGKALFDMAKDASVIEGVQDAFTGMVTSTGRDAQQMLRSLQTASVGMASQEDLMLSYNKAAQLVSTTFANQLPDAFEALSKISSATGEDMGYLIDSLVTGVGRLSPMILDNLGIQVSLNEAYEEYAAKIGKSKDELTKAEQQTALTNQVMAKLAANTKALPSVVGQTDTKMAQFSATLADLHYVVGKLAVPVLDTLVTTGQGILQVANLLITGDFTKGFADFFGVWEDSPLPVFLLDLRNGIAALQAGVPVFDLFANILGDVAQQAFLYDQLPLFDFLVNLRQVVVDVLKPIGDWVNQNIKLEDILLGLGIAVGSVVIPAILGIVGAALPIIATIGGLIVGVAALRQAWESDWGGIRTFVTQEVLPRLNDLWTWFTVEGLPAIRDFIVNEALPRVQEFIDTLGRIWTDIQPGLNDLLNWFITDGLPAIRDFIVNTFLPNVDDLVTTLGDIWTVVSPALTDLKNGLQTAFEWIKSFVIDPAIKAWNNLIGIFDLILTKLGIIQADATKTLGKLNEVANHPGLAVTNSGDLFRQQQQFNVGGLPNAIIGALLGSARPRDSGGPGLAWQPYAIGAQQQGREIFIPTTNGQFVPNAAGGMTNHYHGPITVVASDVADFERQMRERARRTGN